MHLIHLSSFDLSLTALLVLILSILSILFSLCIGRQIIISSIRCAIQLMLIGMVLKVLFEYIHPLFIGTIAFIMLIVAGREVMARQRYKFSGVWGFGIGSVSMFFSSFILTIFALRVVIDVKPWYTPQYSIPLLGMMFGNTMNGIAIGLDQLTSESKRQKGVIEARLILGQSWRRAIEDIRKESIRTAMIPIVNAMAAAGVVSLPGMMTGQILAGAPPVEAVKYQLMIMFLITAGTGFGVISAVFIASYRLFDSRHRLRLDRLKN
ncbi:MAG: iron export ABC transporter permease subunit FetB [Nitrospirae bacterium]|nr:MAG: iron export ABC transporter permease subunit FetB [Nitrospirota bacterium]